MLRSSALKMFSPTVVLLIWWLISGTLAQAPTYVVLDNYTIQNFFNMFTFYTVSCTVIVPITKPLTCHRAMIPLMAMCNMSTGPSLSRTDILLQTRQTSTSVPTIPASIRMEVLVGLVYGLPATTTTLMVYLSLTSPTCRLVVVLGRLSGLLDPTGQITVK